MEKRLKLLETVHMQGDDGQRYVVRAYEHLASMVCGVEERWEPTGVVEYKLDNGRHVRVDAAGRMTIAGTGVALREAAKASAPARRESSAEAHHTLPQHARA